MKQIIERMNFTRLMVSVLMLGLLGACSKKENPQPGSSTNNSTNNNSGVFGEFIPIPGINSSVPGDFALNLKTTNEGLYMEVSKGSPESHWIYRLQSGGPSPSWIYHEEPDTYFDWEPIKYTTESGEQFGIYYQTIDKNGYVNINTGLPALLEEENPYNGGFSFTGEMLYDNSPSANKWAFFGSTVKIKENNATNNFNTICTLPTSGGIKFAEADPYDAVVWAAAGAIVYKISVNGDITTFDVSTYSDALSTSIGKIRFNYDPLHKDVFFNYSNKVFRIADGKTLSLFYTINNQSNFLGGDFAVDNGYMYATDGTKKSILLGTETNIIPPMPAATSTNQQVLLDYITQTSAFKSANIEVLKNSLDNYIYAIYQDKVLKVPKSR